MTNAFSQSEAGRARFDALSMEYAGLRAELSSRMDRRFQILSLFAVAVGLVAGVGSESRTPLGLIIGASVALGMTGLIIWFDAGRSIGRLSTHLAQIEMDINRVISGKFSDSNVLRWELDKQPGGANERSRIPKFFFSGGKAPTKR